MIGTSAALAISGCPFNGPIGGARVGLPKPRLHFEPDLCSSWQIATRYGCCRHCRCGADGGVAGERAHEDQMLGAVLFAHQEMQTVIKAINELVAKRASPLGLAGA